MENKKEWQKYSEIFKDTLGLDSSPVAVSCLKGHAQNTGANKVRVCRAILDASRGKTFKIDKKNNACFGAGWHMGFYKIDDSKVEKMIKKFVVEGEKLFSSYEALQTLISQMGDIQDNTDSHFSISPLEEAQDAPDLVIFLLDANAACRLLTLATFIDGVMPEIKIGGPTCRLSIIYPLSTKKLNISFYDYTSRKMCNVPPDKLIVSIPYELLPAIAESIDKCSAGTAPIEFPPEFRQFLQKRLAQ